LARTTHQTNQLKGKMMLDPILGQSIQRWENEGGLYASMHNLKFGEIAWDKSYQSRNEMNRAESGRSSGTNQNPSESG
jgi:hypothetical protein